eukprot:TRINITY_DN2840_c0_g1_i1.p1 TRINITY_DN2840_c0_g1~~TRINITY_DN2840_c0_g1_i1.p1  ORF type:complete len:140 (-),score=9.30 TRINITY_DN2840_c0_g1_i1:52-471(-)
MAALGHSRVAKDVKHFTSPEPWNDRANSMMASCLHGVVPITLIVLPRHRSICHRAVALSFGACQSKSGCPMQGPDASLSGTRCSDHLKPGLFKLIQNDSWWMLTDILFECVTQLMYQLSVAQSHEFAITAFISAHGRPL